MARQRAPALKAVKGVSPWSPPFGERRKGASAGSSHGLFASTAAGLKGRSTWYNSEIWQEEQWASSLLLKETDGMLCTPEARNDIKKRKEGKLSAMRENRKASNRGQCWQRSRPARRTNRRGTDLSLNKETANCGAGIPVARKERRALAIRALEYARGQTGGLAEDPSKWFAGWRRLVRLRIPKGGQ